MLRQGIAALGGNHAEALGSVCTHGIDGALELNPEYLGACRARQDLVDTTGEIGGVEREPIPLDAPVGVRPDGVGNGGLPTPRSGVRRRFHAVTMLPPEHPPAQLPAPRAESPPRPSRITHHVT